MSSGFSGLSTALTALHAQRRGLEVTGQNIANANTVGYTRQRMDMQALLGTPVPAIYSTWDGAGAGVEVSDITRLRDAFLESRGRTEHASQSFLNARKDVFGRVESIFAEPSDTALQSQLSDFWAGWSDVANQPGDMAARSQIMQRGGVIADGLRAGYDALASQWDTIRTQADAFSTDVNTAADMVAQLNQTIMTARAAGMPQNELADQRDLHLMKLAELVGAIATARDDGTVDVFVGGSQLVSHGDARHVEVVGAKRMVDQATDRVRLRWTDSNQPVMVANGQLAASLDALGDTLPAYADQLDALAAKIADAVNTQHKAGYGMDDVKDRDFFTGTTASTLAVAITDPKQLGVSAAAGKLDGSNADLLNEIGRKADGPDAAYRDMVVRLGVVSQTAQRRAEIQEKVTGDMDALRASDAGVNLDEEMTNMLTYQRAYEAASRVLTSVDQMLDTLINRTGLVGR
jgi:flagellar hook-associated protein 1